MPANRAASLPSFNKGGSSIQVRPGGLCPLDPPLRPEALEPDSGREGRGKALASAAGRKAPWRSGCQCLPPPFPARTRFQGLSPWRGSRGQSPLAFL
jgi:hypothetical protein